MAWKKGETGNRKGRPKGSDSLAGAIKAAGAEKNYQRRNALIERMWQLAGEPHNDAHARVKAAEWIAKHGWPEESRGQLPTDAEGHGPKKVIFEYA